tara:strand:- start:919 stop:1356 length:438 start_codon:yes stop_codon:yes gene_type:complete
MKTYIAGPFFNPYQLSVIEDIKTMLNVHEYPYFSPKDESFFVQGKTTPEEILEVNVNAMFDAGLMVCVTDGKDPGTLFEAGWAYANNLPIIYLWLTGKPDDKFNLVLAATGSVCTTMDQLSNALSHIKVTGDFEIKNWAGDIKYE